MSKKLCNFRIDDEDKAALEEIAQRYRLNASEVLRGLVRCFLSADKNPGLVERGMQGDRYTIVMHFTRRDAFDLRDQDPSIVRCEE